MRDILVALALLLAIEGLAFAAFPHIMRRAMRDAAETPVHILRLVGIGCAVTGIAMIWMFRGFPSIRLL